MRHFTIRIPTKADLELKAMIRQHNERHGIVQPQPQPCTCAVDHGWHMPDGSTRSYP